MYRQISALVLGTVLRLNGWGKTKQNIAKLAPLAKGSNLRSVVMNLPDDELILYLPLVG